MCRTASTGFVQCGLLVSVSRSHTRLRLIDQISNEREVCVTLHCVMERDIVLVVKTVHIKLFLCNQIAYKCKLVVYAGNVK